MLLRVNAQTLAHEFGHALGLRHTHEGYSESTGACPTNTDCTLQGDLVCDTEPMKSLYHSSVPNSCQTGQINPCTSQIYAGGEKNVMAYTYCFRNLFTQGQADRATAQLLQYRQSLINSPVASSTTPNNSSVLTTACTPTTMTNPGNFNIGVTSVKFAGINNYSANYKQASNIISMKTLPEITVPAFPKLQFPVILLLHLLLLRERVIRIL
ncbi:M43 family zinc metalloprotease [Chryseobacterium sp. W4I1]|uniref:M43 family zinc metalloprotease n=1 Tax=Chryseobacterium sp. W4I1 TaxID=3042293 RepID=UPI0027889100|nr:M43 family zinc metalloprotease [Chryseobacterium sp. W4I1]MDQ0783236.1 hypothetical protein [Chryseobacterium sp. W4I1]